MSRTGNCWDNAFAESLFHTLKNELPKQRFKSLEEATQVLFAYIGWYNTKRLHSALGYVSRKRFIYPIRKFLFLDESGHEPHLRAVHADGATAKEAKMGGEARPSGSGVGLMHRLLAFCFRVCKSQRV